MSAEMQKPLRPQVPREFYFRAGGYISPQRFGAYGTQLQEIMSLSPASVLECGIGNGVVSYVLRRAGLAVTTLDFDSSLEPDVVGSLTELPFADDAFDVVACFEVLEHIPWAHMPRAAAELARVSRRRVLVSVPDADWVAALEFQLPRVGHHRFALSLRRLLGRARVARGQHYWVIGHDHVTRSILERVFRDAGLRVIRTFRSPAFTAHRLFALTKYSP